MKLMTLVLSVAMALVGLVSMAPAASACSGVVAVMCDYGTHDPQGSCVVYSSVAPTCQIGFEGSCEDGFVSINCRDDAGFQNCILSTGTFNHACLHD